MKKIVAKKNKCENYVKIKKVCKIMIDNLSNKIININSSDNQVKLWKNEDSALEILTKLIVILNKLDGKVEDENIIKGIDKKISKNDFLALEEFVKNYDKINILKE